MSFGAVSAGIGIASLGASIYKGVKQNSKASAIEKANQRPTYEIPDEYKQNLAIANHMAQIGLPQQQYNNQVNNIYRNQASGLQSLGHGSNPAGVASIVRASNDATNNLNAQDAMARQGNQRYAIGQAGMLAQQKLAQQQYNKFDKYTENFNQAAALRGAANQNINSGLSGAAQLGASLYGSNMLGGALGTTGGGTPSIPAGSQLMDSPVSNRGLGFGAGYNYNNYPFNQLS